MNTCIERFSQLNLKERMEFYNIAFETEENVFCFINLIKELSEDELETLLSKLTANESGWVKSHIIEIQIVMDLDFACKKIDAYLDKVPALMEIYHQKEIKAQELIQIRRNWMKHDSPDILSDQMLGMAQPAQQKAMPEDANVIDLPAPSEAVLSKPDIRACISDRTSKRKYSERALTLAELSYLLWSTQGIRKEVPERGTHFKTVPSGGARQPFETYLSVHHVTGLEPGIYRYLPFGHKLLLIKKDENLKDKVAEYCSGQKFCGYSSVCFYWAVIPYRTEWRYSYVSSKDMLIEAGHICQNLYLACESIGGGTCGIASYNQEKVDAMLELDGKDEFVVYLAPVGFPVDI